MFYSKDLLSRKSPLGAIWTVAHGKKLSKSKLLGISVEEICNQILHPEVPHSLRLQGILVGGVVVVYTKQQVYLLEDVQDMVRQVKEANHIDAHGGRATLKRGSDKAKHATITLGDVEGALDDAKLSDINNLAANVDDAAHIPLDLKLGSFTDVIMEEEDPALFAMPALSSRDSGRLSGRLSEQEEVAGAFKPLPGKARKSKADEKAQHTQPGHGAAAADGAGSGTGVFEEQDEMFNMGDLEGMGDGLLADLGMLPRDSLDQNNAAALHEQQGREEEEFGSLSPKSAERRASVVEEMRAEFEQGDREELPEGEEERHAAQGQRERGAGKKRARGAAAKEGQERPARKHGVAALPLQKASPDALEDIQIKARDFREWTLDSSPLVVPRGVKRAMPHAHTHVLPTTGTEDVISGLSLRKQSAAATEGFGDTLKAAFSLQEMVAWAPPSEVDGMPQPEDSPAPVGSQGAQAHGGMGNAVAQPCRLFLCLEMQDVVAFSLYGQSDKGHETEPAAKRQRTARGAAHATAEAPEHGCGGAARAAAAAAADADLEDERLKEFEGDRILTRQLDLTGHPPDDMGMMMHDEAELHDQVHELPFDNMEVERLRAAGSLTPGQAAALADPAALDSDQRKQLMQQGLLRQPGSAHTSVSDGSSLHLGARPGMRRSDSVAGSDNELMLPRFGSKGTTPRGSDDAGRHGLSQPGSARGGAPSVPVMQWGQNTLADLMPDVGAEGGGLEHLGLQADSEEEHQRLMARSSSEFESHPLATAQFQMLESSGHGTQVHNLRDCVSKHTATVAQLFRVRLAQQEAAGEPDPTVSFLDLAQQLTRSEAVKLFMQVLVTHSMCFVSASQDKAYGDILIRSSHLV